MKTNFKKIKSNSYSDKDDGPTEFKRELSPEEFEEFVSPLTNRHDRLLLTFRTKVT